MGNLAHNWKILRYIRKLSLLGEMTTYEGFEGFSNCELDFPFCYYSTLVPMMYVLKQEFIRKSTQLLQTVHRRHSARTTSQILTIVTPTTADTRC